MKNEQPTGTIAGAPSSSADNHRPAFEAAAVANGVYTAHFARHTPETVAHQATLGYVHAVGDYVSNELRACWTMWNAALAHAGGPEH
jgi:hypothetical protein